MSVSIVSPLGPCTITARAAVWSGGEQGESARRRVGRLTPGRRGRTSSTSSLSMSIDCDARRSGDDERRVDDGGSGRGATPDSMRANSSPFSSSTMTRPVRSSTSTMRFQSVLIAPEVVSSEPDPISWPIDDRRRGDDGDHTADDDGSSEQVVGTGACPRCWGRIIEPCDSRATRDRRRHRPRRRRGVGPDGIDQDRRRTSVDTHGVLLPPLQRRRDRGLLRSVRGVPHAAA